MTDKVAAMAGIYFTLHPYLSSFRLFRSGTVEQVEQQAAFLRNLLTKNRISVIILQNCNIVIIRY